jgi:hypothetical protein
MTTICPHTRLAPETKEALDKYVPGVVYLETPANDDFAYWRIVNEHWGKGEDLIIVEQHVVPEPDFVQNLIDCYEDWCTYAAYLLGKKDLVYWALSCVKFSASLQERFKFPEPVGHWELDINIRTALKDQWPHCHGLVKNLRAEKSLPGPELARASYYKTLARSA